MRHFSRYSFWPHHFQLRHATPSTILLIHVWNSNAPSTRTKENVSYFYSVNLSMCVFMSISLAMQSFTNFRPPASSTWTQSSLRTIKVAMVKSSSHRIFLSFMWIGSNRVNSIRHSAAMVRACSWALLNSIRTSSSRIKCRNNEHVSFSTCKCSESKWIISRHAFTSPVDFTYFGVVGFQQWF